MAYRQLFAVTFVAVGLALAACGGEGASSAPASDGLDDGVPGNATQPPGNSTRAPGNALQPPGNALQPPGNALQPPGKSGTGGGQAPGGGNACERFCDEYDNCPGNNMANQIVRDLCGRGCDELLGDQQCAPLLQTLQTCVEGLPGLCTAAGPSNEGVAACVGSYQSWLTCDDAGDDDPPATGGCTQAGSCMCADNCATCRCIAGADSANCDALCP